MKSSTLLRREVRLNLGPSAGSHYASSGYGGRPAMERLGCALTLAVGVRAVPSAADGYVVSISKVDAAVRERLVPILEAAFGGPAERPLIHHLPQRLLLALDGALTHPVESLEIAPLSTLRLLAEKTMPQSILLSASFEFAASHRLHSPSLSEAENRAQYGRCNNACGHGHNYRIEVTVEHATDGPSRLPDLERAVQASVISRFDHQNLDALPEFAGKVTSVENIAGTAFGMLASALGTAGIRLRRLTIWETDRTSATVEAAN